MYRSLTYLQVGVVVGLVSDGNNDDFDLIHDGKTLSGPRLCAHFPRRHPLKRSSSNDPAACTQPVATDASVRLTLHARVIGLNSVHSVELTILLIQWLDACDPSFSGRRTPSRHQSIHDT